MKITIDARPSWYDIVGLIGRAAGVRREHKTELLRCALAADALNALLESGTLTDSQMAIAGPYLLQAQEQGK